MADNFEAYNTYAELMQALKSLCRAASNGTMFIATPENQFARIVLRAGDVVSLSFRTKHGAEALPLIRGIRAGRFKFSEGQVAVDEGTAVASNDDVLRQLMGDHAQNGSGRAIPADRLVQMPRIAERVLAEFLGPIAGIVCEEHLGKFGAPRDANAASDFIEALAREVRDPAQARSFREQVWAQLTG